MTDDELRQFLGLDRKDWLAIRDKITSAERNLYETMARAENLINRGIDPPGVIVCRRGNK